MNQAATTQRSFATSIIIAPPAERMRALFQPQEIKGVEDVSRYVKEALQLLHKEEYCCNAATD